MDFGGKIVLITGASSGIGAETAQQFAKSGAKVALVGRNENELNQVASKCGAAENVLIIKADLTDDSEVSDIVQKTVNKFGRLDVLVNAAGIVEFGTIETTSIEQFEHLFAINTRAVFHVSKLAVPYLIRTKGSIVNVSSCMSKMVDDNAVAYSMTKVALDHLTRSLACELGAKEVRVNSVNPGAVQSSKLNTRIQEFTRRTPMGRYGSKKEVSRVILFLASPEAAFCTGQTVCVDGGLFMR